MPIFFKPSASDFSLSADSIGNRWLQEPVVRPNGFPLYHWIQTERGEGLLTLEGQELLLKPGDGVLIAPHVPHEYRENDGSGMWFTSFLTFDGKRNLPAPENLQKEADDRMNFKCRKEQQCRNTVSRQTDEDHEKNSSGKLSLWRFRKYLPQPFFQQGNEISDHTDRMVQKGGISKQQVQSIAHNQGC